MWNIIKYTIKSIHNYMHLYHCNPLKLHTGNYHHICLNNNHWGLLSCCPGYVFCMFNASQIGYAILAVKTKNLHQAVYSQTEFTTVTSTFQSTSLFILPNSQLRFTLLQVSIISTDNFPQPSGLNHSKFQHTSIYPHTHCPFTLSHQAISLKHIN